MRNFTKKTETDLLIEKERTKRTKILEKAVTRASLIVATLLLIITMIIMFAVNVY